MAGQWECECGCIVDTSQPVAVFVRRCTDHDEDKTWRLHLLNERAVIAPAGTPEWAVAVWA